MQGEQPGKAKFWRTSLKTTNSNLGVMFSFSKAWRAIERREGMTHRCFIANISWSKNKIVIKFLRYAFLDRISRIKTFQDHSWKVKVTKSPTNLNTKMAVTLSIVGSIEMKQKLHYRVYKWLFKFQFFFWFQRSLEMTFGGHIGFFTITW